MKLLRAREHYSKEISKGILPHSIAYDLHKELYDIYMSCQMGCAHAECSEYKRAYYESPEAQAVDALRCMISYIARYLSMILDRMYTEVRWCIDKEREILHTVQAIIQDAIYYIVELSKTISRKVENIEKLLREDKG